MGISLYFEADGHKAQYVMKLSCYPSELWYTQDQIPDGDCPECLPPCYLTDYQKWLENIIFHLEHITDEMFGKLYPNRRSGPVGVPGLISRNEMIAETKADLETVKATIQTWITCVDHKISCRLSVG